MPCCRLWFVAQIGVLIDAEMELWIFVQRGLKQNNRVRVVSLVFKVWVSVVERDSLVEKGDQFQPSEFSAIIGADIC